MGVTANGVLRALALGCLAACADLALKESQPAPRPEPAPQPVAQGQRPNILFVFTDDHATHAISAYGSVLNQTPNIDRLAREGMLFTRTFCGNSICAPSRATILTGKHSHANGHIDNGTVFDGSQETFPKLLRAAGYQTAIVGKWHLRSAPTGFDHWQVLKGQGPYYNPPIRTADGTEVIEGYTTEVLTDLGLDWLRNQRDPDRPFMLMLQHKAPHRRWQPGPRELGMYDEVEFPEPATLFDDYQGRSSAAGMQEMTLRDHMSTDLDLKLKDPGGMNPEQLAAWKKIYDPKREAFEADPPTGDDLLRWKYQRYMQDYLACIEGVDHQLGRVLDYLDESGLADNTVVIYSSDQGFYLGDHGWYDKRWMYEESLRMPFIVRWPGQTPAGSTCDALCQNIDFGPTFLDLAGAQVPAAMQGVSMVPLLRGERPADWRRSIYYHYYEYPAVHMVNRHYGVRTERHKLIHYYQLGEWELFDLELDPDELTNRADDPAYSAVRAELEAELVRLQELYGETDPEGTVDRIYPPKKDA
jgi:arylsulfatase A-like enzyme